VCQLTGKQGSDVGPEELGVEDESECLAPDDGQKIEQQVQNAREYRERSLANATLFSIGPSA
jgi:hypothetical protein